MEICVRSLQDLDELQLSHLWHFNVQMTSAATEGNVQSGEKLRFVIVTFWASSEYNKLELDELECAIKTEAGEQKSQGVKPAALTPCGTVDAVHGNRSRSEAESESGDGSGGLSFLDVLVPLMIRPDP